jgi:hypothetical protein
MEWDIAAIATTRMPQLDGLRTVAVGSVMLMISVRTTSAAFDYGNSTARKTDT